MVPQCNSEKQKAGNIPAFPLDGKLITTRILSQLDRYTLLYRYH